MPSVPSASDKIWIVWGYRAKVLTGNAAHLDVWWDGVPFDAILLDAPCTASGIVRRHPDVRWLRRETDIAQLARLQKELLQVMWRVLKPGGRLLYCTCSLFKAEGEGAGPNVSCKQQQCCIAAISRAFDAPKWRKRGRPH